MIRSAVSSAGSRMRRATGPAVATRIAAAVDESIRQSQSPVPIALRTFSSSPRARCAAT